MEAGLHLSLQVNVRKVLLEAPFIAHPSFQTKAFGTLVEPIWRVIRNDRVKLALAIVITQFEPPHEGRDDGSDLPMRKHHSRAASATKAESMTRQRVHGFWTMEVSLRVEVERIGKARGIC
jgi:hypothetical protein